MAESRDRLSRPVDIDALFDRRRLGTVEVYRDQPASTFGRLGGGLGVIGRGRNMFGTQPATGTENRPFGSARRVTGNRRGRASNIVLPYWYPRTPLRDITAIVRAYERRRELVGGSRAQEIESPMPQAYRVSISESSSSSSPGAHLERTNSMKTPAPRTALKRCPPSVNKVSKILLAVTNKPSEDSEFITPQKKLLNSIDTVEKQVMQVLQKQQRTASAKKAERERKVRTLLSLR